MSAIPELPELPEIEASSVKSVRLQGTLTKRLPGMASLGSYGNAKELEAEQYANDMRAAFAFTKDQNRRTAKISKAKNRAQERIAQRKTKLRRR